MRIATYNILMGGSQLVRTGKREEAIGFLQETRSMARNEASRRVSEIAAELGMK